MARSEIEYLLLKDKGPYHEVYVRRPLDPNPRACRFYAIVITLITISLIVLTSSLVYVFVVVPSETYQGDVLNWDGRKFRESQVHVLTHTHCGPLEGTSEQDAFVFKGIPYALPPVGNLRWQMPKPLSTRNGTCWRLTRQAKQFASSCVQPRTFGDYHSPVVGSEDCLYLNVWTPSLDPIAHLPVLVWIHGGNLVYGSGNDPSWSPNGENAR
jgi:hypothetical protein